MKSKRFKWEDGIYDSELERVATKSVMNNHDKMLHQVIKFCKGSDKVCLQSGESKDALYV